VTTFPEKWAIVAPSAEKARIIMGYIIDHTFDNPYTAAQLEVDKTENIKRLRRERSKNKLTYNVGNGLLGEVFIVSADSRNKLRRGEGIMGLGSPNVVMDEAALIDDDIESKIFRMLGDNMDNFYCKIGNPFRRNHFLKSSFDPNYKIINIPYQISLEESNERMAMGLEPRITQPFIDEAIKKPDFDILYENKFPKADRIDEKGWSHLILDTELDLAKAKIEPSGWIGKKVLGVDVARGGGNYNAWVLRCANFATLLARNEDNDIMSVVGTTIRLAKEHGVHPHNVFIDDTGVGAGVTDRLREQRFYCNPVKLAMKADEENSYRNRRAEDYWKVKQWLNQGGKLDADENWDELLHLKYRAMDSTGKLEMQPKKDMIASGFPSPDVADALMLTFDKPPYRPEEAKLEAEASQDFDKYSVI